MYINLKPDKTANITFKKIMQDIFFLRIKKEIYKCKSKINT